MILVGDIIRNANKVSLKISEQNLRLSHLSFNFLNMNRTTGVAREVVKDDSTSIISYGVFLPNKTDIFTRFSLCLKLVCLY